MGGDTLLSGMKATYYPPSIQPGFMGAHPPVKTGYGSLYDSAHVNYFQSYRNENISKMIMPSYEWGMMSTPYSPNPDIAAKGRNSDWNRILQMPRQPITFLDRGRQQEVDDFYKACQMHREQYKDHAGRLHPLNYFTPAKFMFEGPEQLSKAYFKSPKRFTKYKDPIVLPVTLERSYRSPPLPHRALTGRYAGCSDISYKR